MFSEHLSSLPVDVFLKSHQQGIQRQLNMLPMDSSGWLFLSLSLSLLAEPSETPKAHLLLGVGGWGGAPAVSLPVQPSDGPLPRSVAGH